MGEEREREVVTLVMCSLQREREREQTVDIEKLHFPITPFFMVQILQVCLRGLSEKRQK